MYSQHKECLLGILSMPQRDFEQNDLYTENHLVDSFRVVLVVTTEMSVLEELYASYRNVECASSKQLEFIQKPSVFTKRF